MKFKSDIEAQAAIRDASNSPGTANQILSSTVSGTAWIDPGAIGGGYLPLSAGSGFPLTGDLYLATASNSGKLFFGTADANYTIFGGGTYGYTGYNTAGYHRFLINGTEEMRINSNGNVGIGTTNPVSGLHVVGEGDTVTLQKSNNVPALAFLGSSTNKSIIEGGDNFNFYTGGTSRIYITNAGNVGIGTSSPDVKFQVQGGAIKAATSDYASPSTGGAISMFQDSNDYGTIWAVSDYNGGWADVAIAPLGGNVGIGTNVPAYKLDVTGDARFGDGNNFNPLIQYAGSGRVAASPGYSFVGDLDTGMFNPNLGNTLAFATGASERMRIASDGNVGIGTTSPGRKLTVQGADDGTMQLRLMGTASQTSYWDIGREALSTGQFRFIASRNGTVITPMVIDDQTGNVGIGTTNPLSQLSIGSNAITTKKPTVIIADGVAGGSLVIRGLSPILSFDRTGASPENKILMDGAGLEFKTGTLDAEGDVDFKIKLDGKLQASAYTQGFLQSDASGNIEISGGGTLPGGPYLPLAGGAMSTNADITNIRDLQVNDEVAIGGATIADRKLAIYNTNAANEIEFIGTEYTNIYSQTNSTMAIGVTGTGVLQLATTGGNLTIANGGNAAFTGTVTAPTFLGDLNGTINTVTTAVTKANATNDTTVATTAFVQNLIGTIPAGLVFQGTWDAATNTPTLTSGTGTTGNFYIVSTSGSTDLDGVTDWVTGDWAVFIEQGATDAWEKIDNSSVLDGTGTGQTVALWSGSGTSNTLTDAPITVSGNNTTFTGAGAVIATGLFRGDTLNNQANTHNIIYRTGTSTFIAGGDKLVVQDSGNVGIGSTAPAAKLNVASTGANAYSGTITKGTNMKGIINALSNNADDMVGIYFGTGTTSEGTHWSGITGSRSQSATDWSTQLNFYTHNEDLANINDATQKMVIKGNGNVGIGTTTPDALLDIGVNNIITLNDTGSSTGFIGLGSYNDGTKNRAQGASYYGFGLEIDRPSQNISFNSYDSNGVTTGGTNILVLTRDGKVGIGTASPNATLEVKTGTSAGTVRLSSDGNGGIFSANGDLQFYTNNAAYATKFYSANKASTLATILDSGNVGIGTTSPNSKLHVSDTTDISMSGGSAGQFAIEGNGYTGAIALDATAMHIYHNSSGRDLVLGTNETARLTISGSSGNTAITGTVTAPTFLGDLNGTINTATTGATQTAGDNSTKIATTAYADAAAAAVPIGDYLPLTGGTLTGNLSIQADSAFFFVKSADYTLSRIIPRGVGADLDKGLFSLYSVNTENVRIDSAGDSWFNGGDVGIGTTNPATKLHVNSGGAGGVARFTGAANFSEIYLGSDGVQSQYTNIVWYTDNGNAQIWKAGTAYTAAGGAGALNIYNSNGDISFHPAGQFNAMTIDSNTNVGIGTTAPQSKLQVDGGIQMAGDTATASAAKVGTMRYRTGTEYVEVTGAELISSTMINGNYSTFDGASSSGFHAINSANSDQRAGTVDEISFVANKTYRVNIDVSVASGNAPFFRAREAIATSPVIHSAQLVAGSNIITFTSTITITGLLEFSNSSSNEYTLSNVSLMEVTAEDASYADMCMQTGASTYEWVNIVRNTY